MSSPDERHAPQEAHQLRTGGLAAAEKPLAGHELAAMSSPMSTTGGARNDNHPAGATRITTPRRRHGTQAPDARPALHGAPAMQGRREGEPSRPAAPPASAPYRRPFAPDAHPTGSPGPLRSHGEPVSCPAHDAEDSSPPAKCGNPRSVGGMDVA